MISLFSRDNKIDTAEELTEQSNRARIQAAIERAMELPDLEARIFLKAPQPPVFENAGEEASETAACNMRALQRLTETCAHRNETAAAFRF